MLMAAPERACTPAAASELLRQFSSSGAGPSGQGAPREGRAPKQPQRHTLEHLEKSLWDRLVHRTAPEGSQSGSKGASTVTNAAASGDAKGATLGRRLRVKGALDALQLAARLKASKLPQAQLNAILQSLVQQELSQSPGLKQDVGPGLEAAAAAKTAGQQQRSKLQRLPQSSPAHEALRAAVASVREVTARAWYIGESWAVAKLRRQAGGVPPMSTTRRSIRYGISLAAITPGTDARYPPRTHGAGERIEVSPATVQALMEASPDVVHGERDHCLVVLSDPADGALQAVHNKGAPVMVVFQFGAVAFFNATEEQEAACIQRLAAATRDPVLRGKGVEVLRELQREGQLGAACLRALHGGVLPFVMRAGWRGREGLPRGACSHRL